MPQPETTGRGGGLRGAHQTEGASPGLRLGRVVQEDEAAGAEIGVGAVARGGDVGRQGDRVGGEVRGGRDLVHHELLAGLRAAQ